MLFSLLTSLIDQYSFLNVFKTQNLNEFELHARAILGIPIPEIILRKNGASAVVLAKDESPSDPVFVGVQKVLSEVNTDVRLFGKPTTRAFRRMGVLLKSGDENTDVLTQKAKNLARQISVL